MGWPVLAVACSLTLGLLGRALVVGDLHVLDRAVVRKVDLGDFQACPDGAELDAWAQCHTVWGLPAAGASASRGGLRAGLPVVILSASIGIGSSGRCSRVTVSGSRQDSGRGGLGPGWGRAGTWTGPGPRAPVYGPTAPGAGLSGASWRCKDSANGWQSRTTRPRPGGRVSLRAYGANRQPHGPGHVARPASRPAANKYLVARHSNPSGLMAMGRPGQACPEPSLPAHSIAQAVFMRCGASDAPNPVDIGPDETWCQSMGVAA